jgi:hypothetical protein
VIDIVWITTTNDRSKHCVTVTCNGATGIARWPRGFASVAVAPG